VALAPPAPSFDEECESLRKENASLKKDIESQKAALVAAEEANGIKQVHFNSLYSIYVRISFLLCSYIDCFSYFCVSTF